VTSRLYNRIARVELAKHDPSVKPEKGGFFKYLPGVHIEKLHVKFSITKTISKEPSQASIHIFNLNANSRSLLQGPLLFVRLQAGYDDSMKQLFAGDVIYAKSLRISDGWDSEIQIGDGDRSYRNARLNKSYRPGVSVKAVIADLTKSMGLKMPTNLANATDLASQFASGHAVSGPSEQEMTRILKKHGYGWNMQDGKMQALKYDQADTQDAVVISQDTGMIGIPELGQPGEKGEPPILKVQTLLDASLKPGGLISVNSKHLKGNYRVQQVTFNGDTHGPDWKTEIEAIPL